MTPLELLSIYNIPGHLCYLGELTQGMWYQEGQGIVGQAGAWFHVVV